MKQNGTKGIQEQAWKVIYWELCKRLTFAHTDKRYMHKTESVLENKMDEIIWESEIQMDHQISARRLVGWLVLCHINPFQVI